ncbi:MAG: phosphate ABC transporter permease subunit PstC, partial [Anaerolineae bacterium]|nr:phosphate ABC transporter permease subunit PstC [Anaerolineae bacterium]
MNPAQPKQPPNNHLIKQPKPAEVLIKSFLFLCAILSILITFGIVYELVKESLLLLQRDVQISELFTSTVWSPQIGEFGIWPLLTATLTTSFIAILVALPLGTFTALYLSEYASKRTRGMVKPVLEVLAGIPTVVYGYFALTFMTPLLRSIFGTDIVEVYNT